MRKKKNRKINKILNWASFIIALIVFMLFFSAIAGGLTLYVNLQKELPSMTDMLLYSPPVATTVYDVNNKRVTDFFIEKRKTVNLKEIPQYAVEATIALEDQRFYSHWGINLFRLGVSLVKDIMSAQYKQGGSTITQQLARNMFLTLDKNFSRKIKEALISIQLEKNFSKDEILEMYFNQINYGNGAHGIEAAANVYFGKSVREIDLAEAALLAGIPNLPEYYNPFKHMDNAKRRQKSCLYAMLDQGFITKEQFYEALDAPIHLNRQKQEARTGQYFIEEVRKEVISRFGYDVLYKGGLRIYTTIDMEMQAHAEAIVERQLSRYEKRYEEVEFTKSEFDSLTEEEKAQYEVIPYLQAGLIIINNSTGGIMALVGGRDFYDSEYNRVFQAPRQPGSIFKIFLFSAAIENGMNPGDIIMDTPVVLDDGTDEPYKPHNYDETFMGPIPMRIALAKSRNVTAVRLIDNIGPMTVVNFARRLGITSKLLPVISLALGSGEVTLFEMTRAFTVFPNYGIMKNASMIRYIEDSEGNIIYKTEPSPRRVMDDDDAYIITSMLETTAKEGTGQGMKWMGINATAGGKTGTTDDYSNAWFVGFTRELTCGVWVGYDELKEIGDKATGAAVALPIWAYTVKPFIDNSDTLSFSPTDSIITVKICKSSGMLPSKYCREITEEIYKIGREPLDVCTKHSKGNLDEYDFEKYDSNH